MSTAMAVCDVKTYQSLTPSDALTEALIQNFGSAEEIPIKEKDCVRVKGPKGGDTDWRIPGAAADEITDNLVGILVHVQRKGTIWPTPGMSKAKVRPMLTTNDFVRASKVEPDKPFPKALEKKIMGCMISEDESGPWFSWAQLCGGERGDPPTPFGWNTGQNGAGKWAKEERMLFILPPNRFMPVIVTVTPGSLGNWIPWYSQLTLDIQLPCWQCVISLKLEKAETASGEPYAKIVPTFVAEVPREDALRIKLNYTDQIRGIAAAMSSESHNEG